MGVVNHNIIVATTWDTTVASRLDQWISDLDERWHGLFVRGTSTINGYKSFVLLPDGSKEGWQESDDGDALRFRLMNRLGEDDYEDGSSPWDWVAIGYGEFGQKVLQGNCKNCYSDEEYAN